MKIKSLAVTVITYFLIVTLLLTSVNLTGVTPLLDAEQIVSDISSNGRLIKQLEAVTDLSGIETQVGYTAKQLGLDLSDEVWLIVTVSDDSLVDAYLDSSYPLSIADYSTSPSGIAVRDDMLNKQAQAKEILDSLDIGVEYNSVYTTLFNGFSIKVKSVYIDLIEALTCVERVTVCQDYYVQYASNDEQVSSIFNQVTGLCENDTEYQGDNMLVAVIDNALDYTHPAFAQFTGTGVIDLEDIEALQDSFYGNVLRGAGKFKADQLYKSMKIPFQYDYAANDTNVMPTAQSVTNYGAWHGTHVSGILTGNDDTITGVVPNAQLVFMKVSSDFSATLNLQNVMSALGDCVLLGVDVVNMSFGSGGGFSTDRSEDAEYINGLYNKIDRLGIDLCFSAGNSYSTAITSNGGYVAANTPDYGVASQPGTYSTNLAVASLNSTPNYLLNFNGVDLQYADSVTENHTPHNFTKTLLGNQNIFTAEVVYIDDFGVESAYEGIDVTGKVVLVDRGDNTFDDKQRIAAGKGAVACIIVNSADELINAIVDAPTIATCIITLANGQIIKDMIEDGTTTLTIDTAKPIFYMSDFSSWGPTSDLLIKPDITSIGGNIYSSFPLVSGQSYAYESGTSMASPNFAGLLTALKQSLKAEYPHYTNSQISTLAQNLLMSTSVQAYDKSGSFASPRKQGAGVADLIAALNTEAYLTVTGKPLPKLELGDDKNKDGIYTLKFNIVNFADNALSYEIDTSVLTEQLRPDGSILTWSYELEGADIKVKVNNGTYNEGIVTVSAGQTATVTVVVKLNAEHKQYLNKDFKNGVYVEGFVTLDAQEEDSEDLSIPWMAFYGDWTDAPIFDYSIYDEKEPYSQIDTALYGFIPQTEWYYQLGAYSYYSLPEGWETPSVSADKIALSRNPNMQAYTALYSVQMALLRNVADLRYIVTDAYTGNVYWEGNATNVSKAYDNNGTQVYTMHTLWQFLSVSSFAWANNQKFDITVEATIDYEGDNATQSISFPIYIDYEAPSLVDYDYRTEDGKTYLDLEMYDNRYLSNILLHTKDVVGAVVSTVSSLALPIYSALPNENNKVTFDITDYIDDLNDERELVISIQDYALNLSTYDLGVVPTDEVVSTNNNHSENALLLQDIDTHEEENLAISSIRPNFDVVDSIVTNSVTVEQHTFDVNESGQLIGYEGPGGYIVIPDNLGITSIAGGPGIFTYRQDITGIEIPEGVTSLGNQAFMYCSNLQTAKLPSTLATLGQYSFERCTSLQSISIPDGVKEIPNFAFNFCQNMESVELPNTVVKLGNYSFAYCHKLTEFDFGAINNIGTNAFMYATGFKELTLPNNGKTWTISSGAFGYMLGLERLTVNANLGTINNGFTYLLNLKELRFYGNVGGLNGNSFQYSTSLEVLEFHGTVGTLGTNQDVSSGFSYMPIKKIEFFNTVNTITNSYFSFCYDLEEVVFHKTVNTINGYPFAQSPKLTRFTVAEGNTSMIMDDETGVMYNAAKTKLFVPQMWDYDGVFTLPSSITTLELGQFGLSTKLASTIICEEFEASTTINNPNNPYDITYYYPAVAVWLDTEEDSIPQKQLSGLVVPASVRALPNYLCRNLSNLETFTMGDSTTSIGQYCFQNCGKLSSINISSKLTTIGNYCFNNCESLTEIALPNGVKNISISSFAGCLNLEKVTIGNAVTTISANAFQNCQSLKEFIMPDTVGNMMANAFSNCTQLTKVYISEKIKMIQSGVFNNCTSLKEVNIPSGVTAIYDNAFANTAVEVIDLPATLNNFKPVYAFFNCTALTQINIAEENASFKSIDGVVYSESGDILYLYPANKADAEFVLPDSVIQIYDYAFASAKNLNKITLSNVEEIYFYAFDGSGLKEVVLNDALSLIEIYAFANLSLDKLFISKGTDVFDYSCVFFNSTIETVEVEEGNQAFVFEQGTLYNYDKTVLFSYSSTNTATVYYIPEGVIKVAGSAFANNQSLTEVHFPTTIKTIGDSAFRGTVNLSKLVFTSQTAPALEGLYNEDYRYMYCNFVDYLEDIDAQLTVYHPDDKTYRNYIWEKYFEIRYQVDENGNETLLDDTANTDIVSLSAGKVKSRQEKGTTADNGLYIISSTSAKTNQVQLVTKWLQTRQY